MAPLTGVPLPFISYGSTNLIVLLGGMGLLLDVAADGGQACRGAAGRCVRSEGGARCRRDRDRGRGHGGSRRAGARGR